MVRQLELEAGRFHGIPAHAGPGSTAAARAGEAELERDAALIDGFERNERRAADQIYARLVGVVEATLLRVLGRRDEHHRDLVQAAFEQILRSLSRRRFERRCGLAAWASTVTAHVALNAIRSRIRERRVIDYRLDADAEAEGTPGHINLEHHVLLREELAVVGKKLAEMDDERATALFLHGVLGHELTQIAVLTGVSVAAAQSRLVRGRRELEDRVKRTTRSALIVRAPSASQ